MNKTYSSGLGSGSDEKYEASIASAADGRACRSMCNNFSVSVMTPRGKILEINQAIMMCSAPKEYVDSLGPFQCKYIIILLRWTHQTVPRRGE